MHNLLRGGAHRCVSEQLTWIERSAEVDEFILEGASPVTARPTVVSLRQRADGMSSWRKPPERYLDFARLEKAWRELDEVVADGDYDAVWMNSCRFAKAPPLRPQLLSKTVYFCQEPNRLFYDPSATRSTRPLTRPLYYPMQRRRRLTEAAVSREVAVMLTNSSFTAAMITRAFGRDAVVCPLGVSPRFGLGDESTPRSGVLSVGTLIPSKGHDLAIAALAACSDVRLLTVIAPRHEVDERIRLQKLADDLGVAVSFRFGISDDELVEAYQRTELTLYLAMNEPFGLVSLEAQVSGSPVIVADEGGLPETIEGSPLGVAVARDPASVARAIVSLGDEISTEERHQAARAVAQRWSWERSSSLVLGQLQEVARP